ncbi:MAG: alpha/beta fold hydrolase, partial [Thermoanaerobaculia bacterium]|nr:alpha/beta fold hydrolase [Thermoanaerobaculia bacterium]
MNEPILTHRVDGPPHGDPLMLLNGGFMTMASWEPCAAPLAEVLRVLRCDFRGQLLTPGPAHQELGPNADDVVALLDHLGLDSVHLLGTSFGGEIGLLLAARYPERVRSLIVVAVSDYTTEAMTRGARKLRRIVEEILADGDRGRFHDVLVEEVYSREHVEENRATLAERREQIASLPESWFHALDDLL